MLNKAEQRGLNNNTPWLIQGNANARSELTLYCFGHAGSLAGEYINLFKYLTSAQVMIIQLPGRGARFAEPNITDLKQLIDILLSQLNFDLPYCFFGHSLGGVVAFELARKIQALGKKSPKNLLLSSSPIPGKHKRSEMLYKLSDEELLEHVEARWGCFPLAIKQNQKVLAASLARLRADFKLFETYPYKEEPILTCDMTTFSGDAETLNMRTWHDKTIGKTKHYQLSGGHFYFRQQKNALIKLLNTLLIERDF